MNRGDVKLMIDQLVCLDLSEADAEIAEFVIAKLEHFGNEHAALADENAKLQANLDRHIEALVKIADTDPDSGTAWFHEVAEKALEVIGEE